MNSRLREDFARGLAKNLLAYALGRELHPEDLENVDAVLQRCKEKQYPLKDVIKALVKSDAFLHR